jgi:hypothetical protein
MRFRTLVTGAVLCALMTTTTPALAQSAQHVASAAMMRDAMAAQASADTQTRDSLRSLLSRDQVRDVASRLGLDVRTAERAVATLTPDELTRLADPVRQAEAQLAGGNTIVISTTTLLLIIIIVILLAD